MRAIWIAGVVVVAVGLVACRERGIPAPKKHPAHEHTATEVYTCPMHPQIVEEDPGTCPVCGMDLVAKKTEPTKAAPSSTAAVETIYACPMHPQIVEEEFGTCPICGMDLVAKETEATGGQASSGRKIRHWVAPMDPSYIRDAPGKSPMGMDLVPVYEEEGGGSTVSIDPVVVQNMGVRIARVERGPIFRHIRTVGTVDVAEDQLSVVNLRYSGWVERIYVDETGKLVKRGQALFDIYSPELVSAQEEYLVAKRSAGPDSALVKSARTRLSLWGLSSGQIDRLGAAGPSRTITVVAPQTGYVLHKNVVQGARIKAGSDLYRIGNLAKIWVNADVYEFDAPWVNLGAPATMELSFQQGKTYEGTVAYIYPTLNQKTRTLRVRLEFDNPGLVLKPGMFAIVRVEAQRQDDVLTIPTEAVIHSGTRQLVFVTIDFGRYEMREITTGLVGDRHLTQVLSGLSEGERVVTSWQFLLDSESQLQEAVQKMLAARLHSAEPGVDTHAVHNEDGGSYWSCGMHPQIVEEAAGTCPICGMDLTEKKK